MNKKTFSRGHIYFQDSGLICDSSRNTKHQGMKMTHKTREAFKRHEYVSPSVSCFLDIV